MERTAFAVFLVLQVIFAPAVGAQGFGVFPVNQSIEVQAGRPGSIGFDLLNFSDEALELEVSHEYTPMAWDPQLADQIPNPTLRNTMRQRVNDHGPWIEIAPEITLPPNSSGGTGSLNIDFAIPNDASGTYSGSFVFTEKKPGFLKLSYRCNYNLIVTNRPLVKEILVSDVGVSTVDGNTMVRTEIRNIGNTFFELAGQFEIVRKIGNRGRPVDKGEIEVITVNPGRASTIDSEVTGALPSGIYEVRILPEINARSQRPRVLEIKVTGPRDKGRNVLNETAFVGPVLSSMAMRAGSIRSETVAIENAGSDAISVSFDIPKDQQHAEALKILPASTTIRPNTSKGFRVQIAAPEDMFSASEVVQLTAFATLQTLAGDTEEVPLEFWIQSPETPLSTDLTPTHASIFNSEDGRLTLELTVMNEGVIPVTPTAEIAIVKSNELPIWTGHLQFEALAPNKKQVTQFTLETLPAEIQDRLRQLIQNELALLEIKINYPAFKGDKEYELTITESL